MKLKLGQRVKWNDPGINDYEPEERQAVLDRIFVVVSHDPQSGFTEIEEAGGCSQAEVWDYELEILPGARIGDTIRIDKVQDESDFFKDGVDHQARSMNGLTGVVEHIDDAGNLWGTWGGMAVLPEDQYTIIKHKN